MKKSILKLLIVITIISLILLFFVGCKSPGMTELEERIEKLELEEKIKALEDELAKKEAEEASPEEEGESPASDIDIDNDEIGEEPTEEEEPSEEEGSGDEEADADADKEAPTISLAIYEGPSLDGSICYYRVEATVTGSPTVSFSKDDSGGAWGSKKVQININNPGDTYSLTATATNSEGSDTDSIALSWGCAIPAPDPIVKSVDINADFGLSGDIFEDWLVEQGEDYSFVGDTVQDKLAKAYFSFNIDDLGDINGIIIKNLSVSIPIDAVSDHPENTVGSTVSVAVCYYGNSLELSDLNLGGVKTAIFSLTNSMTNFDFSSNKMKNELQKAVDVDKKWFQLRLETSGILANGIWDYYKIPVGGVVLHVTYEVPG